MLTEPRSFLSRWRNLERLNLVGATLETKPMGNVCRLDPLPTHDQMLKLFSRLHTLVIPLETPGSTRFLVHFSLSTIVNLTIVTQSTTSALMYPFSPSDVIEETIALQSIAPQLRSLRIIYAEGMGSPVATRFVGALSSLTRCVDLVVDWPYASSITDLSVVTRLERFSLFTPPQMLSRYGSGEYGRLEFLHRCLPKSMVSVCLRMSVPGYGRRQVMEIKELVESTGLDFLLEVVAIRNESVLSDEAALLSSRSSS